MKKRKGRKPLADKDTNVADLPLDEDQDGHGPLQALLQLSHNEVNRRIAAIRAIKDVQVEAVVTQLRLSQSKLSDFVLDMPLIEFVKAYCPNIEAVNVQNNFVELRRKQKGPEHPNIESNFEFLHDMIVPGFENAVLPTPRSFSFTRGSAAREELMRSIERFMQSEDRDEEWCKTLSALKGTKAWEMMTPRTEDSKGIRKGGVTPRTDRLPKRGEVLMSMNGSPLGLYGKDGIQPIPEEEPPRKSRAKRELRGLY